MRCKSIIIFSKRDSDQNRMKVYNSNSMVKACYDHLYHLLFAAAKDTDKQIASGCYSKLTPFDQICSNDIRLPICFQLLPAAKDRRAFQFADHENWY